MTELSELVKVFIRSWFIFDASGNSGLMVGEKNQMTIKKVGKTSCWQYNYPQQMPWNVHLPLTELSTCYLHFRIKWWKRKLQTCLQRRKRSVSSNFWLHLDFDWLTQDVTSTCSDELVSIDLSCLDFERRKRLVTSSCDLRLHLDLSQLTSDSTWTCLDWFETSTPRADLHLVMDLSQWTNKLLWTWFIWDFSWTCLDQFKTWLGMAPYKNTLNANCPVTFLLKNTLVTVT